MDAACNLGPRQAHRRLVLGLVMLLVGVAGLVALIAAGAPRWWRVGLVVPFWIGELGLFQARAKT
jgi:hypothetical protein